MPSNANSQNPPDPAQSNVTRRDFLKLVAKTSLAVSGLLGLGALARYLSYQPDPQPPDHYDLGSIDLYPTGSSTVIPAARAILINTPAGLRALSLVCPHLGCTVKPTPDGYVCPCHGSRFNQDGALANGPASKPLQELRVEVTASQHVILYTQG